MSPRIFFLRFLALGVALALAPAASANTVASGKTVGEPITTGPSAVRGATVVWTQPPSTDQKGSVVAATTRRADGSWSGPTRITPEISSRNPYLEDVEVGPGGRTAVVWTRSKGYPRSQVEFAVGDEGVWAPPAVAGEADGSTTQITVDAAGNVDVFWMLGNDVHHARRQADGTLVAPEPLGFAPPLSVGQQPDASEYWTFRVAATPAGALAVAKFARKATAARIEFVTRPVGGSWSAPHLIASTSSAGDAAIDLWAADANNFSALWSFRPNDPRLSATISADGALGPATALPTVRGFGTLTTDHTGQAGFVGSPARGLSFGSDLIVATSAAGRWGPGRILSDGPLGYEAVGVSGTYVKGPAQLGLSPDGSATLVYRASGFVPAEFGEGVLLARKRSPDGVWSKPFGISTPSSSRSAAAAQLVALTHLVTYTRRPGANQPKSIRITSLPNPSGTVKLRMKPRRESGKAVAKRRWLTYTATQNRDGFIRGTLVPNKAAAKALGMPYARLVRALAPVQQVRARRNRPASNFVGVYRYQPAGEEFLRRVGKPGPDLVFRLQLEGYAAGASPGVLQTTYKIDR